jgi:hypothetical protein
MTSIVRKFKRYGTEQQRRMAMGGEACANHLRREIDEIERDTERAVSRARHLIERERVRETER